MKSIPLLLIAGSLSLFAAGCGGDDKDSDSAARGYDETGQAINDVCVRAEAEAKPAGEKVTGEANQADADALQELVDINEKYIAEIKEIKPDSKLQATYDDYVGTLDRMQELTVDAQKAAADGDKAAFQSAAQEIQANDVENDRLGQALGAPDCATD